MTWLVNSLREAIAKLPARDLDFATSILKSLESGKATPKQEMWAQKLVERAATPPTAEKQVVLQVEGILKLLAGAASKLKYPKIRLVAEDGQKVVLGVAGPRSKYTGSVMVTDGQPFGQNVYFGRIDTDGNLTESRSMTPAVMALLQAFSADPAGVGSRIGRTTGSCCFCSRQLDTRESLAVGYGPVCASNYNLPWG